MQRGVHPANDLLLRLRARHIQGLHLRRAVLSVRCRLILGGDGRYERDRVCELSREQQHVWRHWGTRSCRRLPGVSARPVFISSLRTCATPAFCVGHGSRESCTAHANSTGGSQSILACVCKAGYYQVANTTCYTCASDHYCPGDDAMYSCPANSTSPSRSETEEACQCRTGFAKT